MFILTLHGNFGSHGSNEQKTVQGNEGRKRILELVFRLKIKVWFYWLVKSKSQLICSFIWNANQYECYILVSERNEKWYLWKEIKNDNDSAYAYTALKGFSRGGKIFVWKHHVIKKNCVNLLALKQTEWILDIYIYIYVFDSSQNMPQLHSCITAMAAQFDRASWMTKKHSHTNTHTNQMRTHGYEFLYIICWFVCPCVYAYGCQGAYYVYVHVLWTMS